MRVCISHHPNWHNHALENQPSPLSEKGSGAWGFRLFDGRSCGIGRYNILFSLCFQGVGSGFVLWVFTGWNFLGWLLLQSASLCYYFVSFCCFFLAVMMS